MANPDGENGALNQSNKQNSALSFYFIFYVDKNFDNWGKAR